MVFGGSRFEDSKFGGSRFGGRGLWVFGEEMEVDCVVMFFKINFRK